jgi:hypothetical protein
VLAAAAAVGPARSADTTIDHVVVGPVDYLFNERSNVTHQDRWDVMGRWSITTPVVDRAADLLRYRLEVQVPTPPEIADERIVLAWQAVVTGLVPEASRGLVASRVLGPLAPRPSAPPESVEREQRHAGTDVAFAVARGTCLSDGDCAARFHLDVPLRILRDIAAETDQPWVDLRITVVRASAGDAILQVLIPVMAQGQAGTIAEPGRSWGTFMWYRPFPARTAQKTDLPLENEVAYLPLLVEALTARSFPPIQRWQSRSGVRRRKLRDASCASTSRSSTRVRLGWASSSRTRAGRGSCSPMISVASRGSPEPSRSPTMANGPCG